MVGSNTGERKHLMEGGINDFDAAAPGIPARKLQWLIAWIFIAASVCLTTEFILIHVALTSDDFPDATKSSPRWALINWLGSLEAILWFQGFVLLIYWLVYEIPFGFQGTMAAVLKLIAAVFFNVQPASAIFEANDNGKSVYNFVGICLFHSGNMLSTWDMRAGFDKSRPFSHANLPIIGMWVYTLATTLLVTADGLVQFKVDIDSNYIPFAQITGASLLGVGSIIYAYWSRPAWYFYP